MIEENLRDASQAQHAEPSRSLRVARQRELDAHKLVGGVELHALTQTAHHTGLLGVIETLAHVPLFVCTSHERHIVRR